MGAGPTAHFNEFAGNQVAAKTNLLVGFDTDFRVTAKAAHGIAQLVAIRVIVAQHLATGEHLPHQPGVAARADFEHAIRVGDRQNGGLRQAHAHLSAGCKTRHVDRLAGANARTQSHGVAAQGNGVDAQHEFAGIGLDANTGELVGPVDGLARQASRTVEALHRPATREHHATKHDVANRFNIHPTAGLVTGPARRGDTGDGVENDGVAVVVRARTVQGSEGDRLGCGQAVVEQYLLARRDTDRGVRPQVAGAVGVAHRTGQHRTMDFHVVLAGDGDAGASTRARERAGRVHIHTGAVQRHAGQLRATAVEGDVAVDLSLTLPEHTAV